jgi:hypothetical protein
MDQDQISALIVALIAGTCILAICIRHLRDQAVDDYDLQEELEV